MRISELQNLHLLVRELVVLLDEESFRPSGQLLQAWPAPFVELVALPRE